VEVVENEGAKVVELPVRRTGQRLGTVVLDELKERLLSGQYPAGSRISIEEVKAEFGVSKQPVMDAMRRLEAIGIVQIVPQSGCRVANHTAQEVLDFFNLFGRFEGEIAAAAAARRTDDQLLELDATWQRIADLEQSSDTTARSRGYRFLNREFHLVIHHMAHSRVMAELSERMWDMSDFFINTIGGAQHLSDAVTHRNHDHDVIRSAIRSRNAEVARVAMQSHIVETTALFSDDLDKPA
jgi:DNA-binding GntR family transcriptional regulator